ncbi:hypothetical protein GCM10010470_37260 [Saccharopolyspora taberi]|uniref:Uncharacterized protein n=1 Tax=Saccharopolyspora taberi TaxID=60895 RepID=A0ABN3VFS3_9PSEU
MTSTPSHSRITRAARKRMKTTGQNFTAAREDVLAIIELAEADELSFAEAEAVFDDPANQLLCETCGWTVAMICPECTAGCGCNNGRCSGWRHAEFAGDDDEMNSCPECGGDPSNHYSCECGV